MAKRKKTLQQKKRAEARKELSEKTPAETPSTPSQTHPSTNAFSYTFKTQTQPKQTTKTYSLGHDLSKTLYVSLGIVSFQLLLFILLHNHTLVLPLVSFRY